MELFWVYILVMLDNINGFFCKLTIISSVLGFVLLMGGAICREGISVDSQSYKTGVKLHSYIPYCIIVMVLSLFINATLPNTKQAMLIVGGYYATNIEGVQELPENIVNATNAFLEEYALTNGDNKK